MEGGEIKFGDVVLYIPMGINQLVEYIETGEVPAGTYTIVYNKDKVEQAALSLDILFTLEDQWYKWCGSSRVIHCGDKITLQEPRIINDFVTAYCKSEFIPQLLKLAESRLQYSQLVCLNWDPAMVNMYDQLEPIRSKLRPESPLEVLPADFYLYVQRQ